MAGIASYKDIPASRLRRMLSKEKRLTFVTSVDFLNGELWDALVGYGVVSRIQMENIRANAKSSSAQASAFLRHLERRSDRDYYKFFDALAAVDMHDSIKRLTGIDPSPATGSIEPIYNPRGNSPYTPSTVTPSAPPEAVPATTAQMETTPEAPTGEPETLNVPLPEPKISPPTGPNIIVPPGVQESGENGTEVNEEALLQHPTEEQSAEIEAVERGLSEIVLSDAFGIEPVNVIQTERTFYEDMLLQDDETREYYKVDKPERGQVLIINNKNFHGRGDAERLGTDVDADKLEQLWTQLHFRTITYTDLSAQQIMLALQHFAGNQRPDAQACIIYILTHGKAGQIFGVDNREVFLDQIYSVFDNEKCAAMRGKPKLFFFQACQGDTIDGGLVYADSAPVKDSAAAGSITKPASPQKVQPVQSDVDPVGTTRKPRMTDYLVGYPSLEGYRSFRGETGSWYIQAMVKTLAKYASRCDLIRMLTLVNKVVSRRVGVTRLPTGHEVNATQMPNYNSSLTKDLYFFPGIVEH